MSEANEIRKLMEAMGQLYEVDANKNINLFKASLERATSEEFEIDDTNSEPYGYSATFESVNNYYVRVTIDVNWDMDGSETKPVVKLYMHSGLQDRTVDIGHYRTELDQEIIMNIFNSYAVETIVRAIHDE